LLCPLRFVPERTVLYAQTSTKPNQTSHQTFNLCADLRIQVQPDIWDGVEVQYRMAVKSAQHRGSHILSNINAVPLAIMIN
jgi:hypothetical protein